MSNSPSSKMMATSAARRLRAIAPHLTRSVSHTIARNSILTKNPDDVVVTFAMRTAMGRAKKGQLKDTPVDELLAGLFKVYSCVIFDFGNNMSSSFIRVLLRRPN